LPTPNLIATRCPVCAHSLAVPFFDGGMQPLATLGWPRAANEAQAMQKLPHDFVQCPKCTHVWNRSFRYEAIPYKNNPNRMFNRGGIWVGHLAATRDLLLQQLPMTPTVIDIGCGEGHFVRGLAEARERQGRFIGFDPNASPESGQGVEFHSRLFEPLQDMPSYLPDAVVIRHVLEHLIDPAELLDQLAWGAAMLSKPCWLFAEMPCIDRVFTTQRVADFFYEHVAHFTTQSFRVLMERAGVVEHLAHGYDGEVVYALVKLAVPKSTWAVAESATAFAQHAAINRKAIREQLDDLAASGARVAIWGGTGKAAAFIHQFGADAKRFPLVVDSDQEKAGTFVPGTGQEIQFRDVLKTLPVDVVVIPTQWRAKDIVAEMQRHALTVQRILIEHNGRLIDFNEPHPYR
jgi:C-methyltransferase C-terminal domain/Methyltransferase domain